MDAVSSGKDFTWFFSQGWSTLVVALIIYGGGLTAEQIVLALWPQTGDLVGGRTKVMDPKLPVLFRLWWLTRLAHPFIVGAAVSFVPGLPAPDFVTSHTSGALWFGFAGMLNGQLHQIAEAVANQTRKVVELAVPWARSKIGLAPSTTVVPPAAAATTTTTTTTTAGATVATAHDPSPSTSTALPAEEEERTHDDPPEAA